MTNTVAINGPALRHIRELMRLTATELADEIGVTPGYLWKVEAGAKKRIGIKLFGRLLDALRIHDRRVLLLYPPIDDGDDRPLVAASCSSK